MKTFNSLKLAAVLVPALALGIPMANASDEHRNDPRQQERQQQERQQQDRQQQRDQQTGRMGDQHSQQHGRTAQFLENRPTRGFHSDSLVGQDVKSRGTDNSIGTVSNLLIDHEGQVVAVIIGVGGMLGIGERDVAISWDQIELRTDEDNDTTMWVNLTEENLKNAPEYSSDVSDTSRRTGTRR